MKFILHTLQQSCEKGAQDLFQELHRSLELMSYWKLPAVIDHTFSYQGNDIISHIIRPVLSHIAPYVYDVWYIPEALDRNQYTQH